MTAHGGSSVGCLGKCRTSVLTDKLIVFRYMHMTLDTLLDKLRRAVGEAGGMRAYTRLTGVNVATVSLVLSRKEDPSPKLLAALGYEKITTYKKVKV